MYSWIFYERKVRSAQCKIEARRHNPSRRVFATLPAHDIAHLHTASATIVNANSNLTTLQPNISASTDKYAAFSSLARSHSPRPRPWPHIRPGAFQDCKSSKTTNGKFILPGRRTDHRPTTIRNGAAYCVSSKVGGSLSLSLLYRFPIRSTAPTVGPRPGLAWSRDLHQGIMPSVVPSCLASSTPLLLSYVLLWFSFRFPFWKARCVPLLAVFGRLLWPCEETTAGKASDWAEAQRGPGPCPQSPPLPLFLCKMLITTVWAAEGGGRKTAK